jgi:uncharacterized protein (TIGR02757 family)
MSTHVLQDLLERLYRETDHAARRDRDPVRFVWRYADPADQEVAGVFAAGLAFGRVDLFLPVLDALFTAMDAEGGPRAFLDRPPAARHAALAPLRYRWTTGDDLATMAGAVGRALGRVGSLELLFDGPGPMSERLGRAIDALRGDVLAEVGARGAPTFAALPQGLRYLLPHPRDGSGCKRWNLYLRWMVRPASEGVDLGCWTTLRPRDLVMPIDVHVGRLSRFLGLTARADAGWRTAEEVTESLRALDAEDPVRFDFALAYLGISGGCLGYRDAVACAPCALAPVCRAEASPLSTSRRTRG